MHLIPKVKSLKLLGGELHIKAIKPFNKTIDERIKLELSLLPQDINGLEVFISIENQTGENYSIEINADGIFIKAQSLVAVFYAVQTLKQIFAHQTVPYLYIEDYPDFSFRGYLYDVSRGRVPKVETIKAFVNLVAFFKMNSFQLYVEHTYEFKERKHYNEQTDCLTASELKEIDEYCKSKFIDFVPALATFGHMYEILEQPEYRHLRAIKNFTPCPSIWRNRIKHHTINPEEQESVDLVKSMLNQHAPNFTSKYFNVCGDETFDLEVYANENGKDTANLYAQYMNQIISHVNAKCKTAMLWADVVLEHPETISSFPKDSIFLNWDYGEFPKEENTLKLKESGVKFINCPSISCVHRFVENIRVATKNVADMTSSAYKHGAIGVLNTKWGDWGDLTTNQCALYNTVFGAERAWSVSTPCDQEFESALCKLIYRSPNATQYLKRLNAMQELVRWVPILNVFLENKQEPLIDLATLDKIYSEYHALTEMVSQDKLLDECFKKEILIALKGIALMGYYSAKLNGYDAKKIINQAEFIKEFSESWLSSNKPGELHEVIEIFEKLQSKCN